MLEHVPFRFDGQADMCCAHTLGGPVCAAWVQGDRQIARGSASPDRPSDLDGGRPGGGPDPLPLIVQLLVPVARASFGGEVEDIPERLEGADVTLLLVAVRRGVEEL